MERTNPVSAGPNPPYVRKPREGVRLLGPVDVAPLEAILERLSENLWCAEDEAKPNKFGCFHHTRHVIFRFSFQDVRDFRSWPAWHIWSGSLLPVMTEAVAGYGFSEPTFPRAMFARLAAGHRIDVHVDGMPGSPAAFGCSHKIHVPVRTEPSAVLEVDGVERHLRQGHAYEVNNILPHGAFNGGVRDRVHFIFEVFDGSPSHRLAGGG